MQHNTRKIVVCVSAALGTFALSYYLWKRFHEERIIAPCKQTISVEGRPIYIVTSYEQFETLVKKYGLLRETVVGFDAEWTRRNPLSIVQLTFRNVNIIIQVSKLDRVPIPSLNEIMENEKILKTGIGIHEDIRKLIQYLAVDVVNGVVDVVDVAKLMGHKDEKTSLQYLTEKYYHITLDKNPKIRCGNWDKDILSEDQVLYAAHDSYYSRELFTFLYNMYLKSSNSLALSAFDWVTENDLIKSLDDCGGSGRVRVRVIDKNGSHYSSIKLNEIQGKMGGYSKRKNPVYEDCQLLSPDNQLLCRCSKKKLDWYVRKGIGEVVKDDPYTVRLLFEPKSRTTSSSIRLLSQDNCCVVCGKNTDYVCHSIIPHRYRKFLPNEWKSHNNHDNVVLCIPCSIRCNRYDDIYSKKIIREAGYDSDAIAVVVNREVLSIKKVAAVLLRIYNGEIKPPHARKLKLETELLEFLRKYNPDLWDLNDGVYQCMTEAQYKEKLKEDSSPEVGMDIENQEGENSEKEEIVNRFDTMTLNEEEGVQNFDQSLLIKVNNLSGYSIDPNFVSPEEKIMRNLLSQPDPRISLMFIISYLIATRQPQIL